MRGRAVVLALVFLLSTSSPVAFNTLDETTSSLSPSNPTGVDVRVVDATVEYTNSADEGKYKMFSSNHPILGFNRPAELFVIDAMVNITSTLTITVENIGTSPSGIIDVNVLLLHDEYIYFEFSNTTVQMASLSGSASNTVTVDVSPSYAGNHTLQIRATSSVSDDVPGNDVRNQPFTVGYDYFNCDSSSAWTFGNGWQISTDTSISQSRSCHAGNGQSSNYNNNALSALT
ncbi:MAG: CARDB domain-containing protein, partial [Poseidonia sp.]